MIRHKYFLAIILPLVLGILFCLLGPSRHASALTSSNYSNNLIDDIVFRNSGTMSVSAIQAFLVNEGSGLATFSDTEDCGSSSGSHYSYYQTYYSCGSSEPASKIVYDAAHAYGINPEVILATLQKEQSLITTPNPTSSQLNYAMGYGCPDSGGCSFPGFFNQVDNGTWQFRTDMELGSGNNWWGYTPSSYPCNTSTRYYSAALKSGNNVTFYDDNGTAYNNFTLADMSTATLYCYTPHVYNNPNGLYGLPTYGTTGDYYSGSYNFVYYYWLWFGSPFAAAEDYQFVTSTATALHYNPGQTGSVTIVLENIGHNTWYSDHNLPAGQQSTRLATIGYQNSPFISPDANSLYTLNQVLMTPDVVAPGSNATFTFDTSGPYKTLSWDHYFEPIVGGAFLKNVGMDVVLYADTPSWQLTGSTLDTLTPLPNQQALATFSVQNTSSATWYSDHNLPAGQRPTRLATIGYQNSPFADTADPRWLGTRNQILMTPDVVAPGQTATFVAYFIGPISRAAVSSTFPFFIEVGGVFTQDHGCTFTMNTPAANLSYQFVTTSGVPAVMSKGTSAPVTLTIKNTGNVVWQDENFDSGAHALRLMMSHPSYSSSAFYDAADANWLAPSQIAKTTGTVWPGQNANFSFTWLAPMQTGSYSDPFQPIIGGNFMQDIGMVFNTTVQ